MDAVRGIVLGVTGIGPDGETEAFERVTLELEDDTIDVRIAGARRDVVYVVPLADVEEAVRALKRWKGRPS